MPSHAIQRAPERYGLNLQPRHLVKICHIVQNNGATLDRQNPDGTTQWFLEYRGQRVRVLISQDFHCVVTFLPLHDRAKMLARKKGGRKERGRKRRVYKGGRALWVEAYPT